jgi:tetratricopeptide (TPR) repeat protein
MGMVTSNSISAQDLDAATSLTRSEQYDKAAEMFKQLIQKEPGNSRYFFFYGENTLQEYFADTISNSLVVATKEAKDLYNKGISANPNEPLNYVGLAKVAFYLDDNKTADEMRAKAKSFLLPYKNIKRIVPPAKDYAFTLAKLAESYITADNKVDTGLALPLIREAINIDSKSRDIYLIAGDIFNIKNDGSNAIKYYNLAQEYDQKSPTANMKIGSIYVKARNLTAAIPFFELAIALNSNYAPAYRELGAMYTLAGRNDKAKENFKKYLDLTQGNIPAKIIYVKALFYTGEYDEAIKNVEEIFAVDKSKTYMNRIAGYSCYEKKDPDYNKALSYMETLFKTVSPDRIIKKDYIYMAKILLKKNLNYPNLVRDNDRVKAQLERDKKVFAAASAAEKAKLKPNLDTLTNRVARADKQIARADVDINRAFG